MTTPSRPNIVLIMADDMGFSDLGCYGSEIRTPHLDALAGNGVRFTNFYNAARCCPTRASLLTGLHPHQTGMGGMVNGDGVPGSPYRGALNQDCVTLAEVLKGAGYATYMSGKWHVGEEHPNWPMDRGFDRHYGLVSGGMNYFDIRKAKKPGLKRHFSNENEAYEPPAHGFYATDAFTDYAVERIESHPSAEQPFFLYLAYTAPHWPLHALPEDIAKYEDRYKHGWPPLREERFRRLVELGLINPAWGLSPADENAADWEALDDETRAVMARKMAIYAAQIDRMDQGIGRVVDALKRTGVFDNTLLLFLSDNGACHEGGPLGFDLRNGQGGELGGVDSFQSYGLSWSNASNTPFRRHKHWVHEGGISTPLIVHWPGHVAPNSMAGDVGHVIDIMPTCCEIAGATYPAEYQGHAIRPFEGRSLLPVFHGDSRTPPELLHWAHEGNHAIRSGQWKLVMEKDRPWELYDIEADRTELHNQAGQQPERVTALRQKFESWAKAVGVCTRYVLAVMLLLTAGLARAEQEGDYARETRNLPEAELTPDRIPGLLLWLRSDQGVAAAADGVVQVWADQSGNGNDAAANSKSEKPALLTPNVIGGKPAVTMTDQRQKSPGFQTEPLTIAPEKGMTLFALARVNAPVHIGHFIGYGTTYKTAGSLAMYAQGSASLGRSLLYASTGAETPALEATAGNVVGKGFSLFAVRFDPSTGEESLFLNGVPVGRTARSEPLAERNAIAVGTGLGGNLSLNGDILAALAYNNALSLREMQGVQRTLEATYGLGGKPVSTLAPLLPFAYYPSRNQMEAAIELSAELIDKAGGQTPDSVGVRVISVKTGKQVAGGSVPLDGQGRGQAVFEVPDFPDGEYAVEYVIGKHVERSPQTFERIHFPFEKSAFGNVHKVYPPFEPVAVHGAQVTVVGRRYTVNAQGLLDSVVSLDRELLAAPMQLVAQTANGDVVTWTSAPAAGVKGTAAYPDQAVFECESSSAVAGLRAKMTIEEDGCARVELTLSPADEPATIERLWLDIPVKDIEAPLFHYIGDNGMRFNYAGNTPRGGRIEWYREPWDGWVPQRWRVAEPGPDDGVVWTSADTRQHGNTHRWDHRPFSSYIWLGGEYRGLALLLENEQGFATDYTTPLQRVIRDGDRVVIRLEIFQQPVKLDAARTFTFGFMASPGKPMEPEFRTRPFASGVGPVSCWGGWQCASKYPTEHDWSIVDKIQDIRRRAEYTDADQQWFDTKYEQVKQQWPERKINGSTDWLWLTTHFAKRAAERGAASSGIYFEEHATDPRLPEFQVFQDEWASGEFNRFQKRSANWGVFSPSYHDFALYMANEWMSRGVSLYFDNTNPKRCYNYRFGPAYRSPDGALRYGISIFGQRAYYRRIYKLLSEWNERGAEYPIDFTLHITNTQTVPYNTWATATLDLEQRAYTENPEEYPPETELTLRELSKGGHIAVTELARKRLESQNEKIKAAGYQLPWPPDYTRTVTFARQAGVIPTSLDFVSGHGRHLAADYSPAMLLRDWSMSRMHDIRTGQSWVRTAVLANDYDAVMNAFGYGNTGAVEHHNYWLPETMVSVDDERVKWFALRRPDGAEPFGLLLLQSYSRPDAPAPAVNFAGAAALLDIETRELILMTDNTAAVPMPPNLSTRMFLVAGDPGILVPLAETGPLAADFALAVPVGWKLTMSYYEGRSRVEVPPAFLPREEEGSRRFWRIPGGIRDVEIAYRNDREILDSDYDVSVRFRLGNIAAEARGQLHNYDLLNLAWRHVAADPKKQIELRTLRTALRVAEVNGQLQWQLRPPEAVRGKERLTLPLVGVEKIPDRLPAGPAAFEQWYTLTARSRGTSIELLLDGKLVANATAPESWSGTVVVSQGSLLAGKRAEYLDIADLVISPVKPQ